MEPDYSDPDGLERLRLDLERKVNRRRHGQDVLFHYTTKRAALEIAYTRRIQASETFRGTIRAFPAGAYATDIAPWNPLWTQSAIRSLFFGENAKRDLSWFVAVERYDFDQFRDRPHFFVRYKRAGEYVRVNVLAVGPNLMLR